MQPAREWTQAELALTRPAAGARGWQWRTVITLAGLALAIGLPRVTALDRHVAPDEKRWLTHSANFYRALTRGDFGETYQIEHPGVTVMWVGTLAYLARYPTYPQVAPGQIEWWREEVAPFLLAHGHTPLEVLTAGHLGMALTITLVLAVAAGWARRLVGTWPAVIGFLLIAADPFHIALSRLLHLDGLASSLMLLSVLALLCFLYRGGQRSALAVSGVAAGLAWLTKSPTLFLIPFTGLALLLELAMRWRQQRRLTRADWQWALKSLVVWGGVGAVVFVLLWPAMWVDPLWTLWRMLRAAVGYAVNGHEVPIYFNGRLFAGDPGWQLYPATYLWRTTPIVLVGLALAGAAMLLGRARGLGEDLRRPLGLLLVFAVLFTVFMSLGAKKFDRYLLPVYPPLALAASVGWVAGAGWLRGLHPAAVPASRLLVVGAQAGLALSAYPYYLSYYNPLLGGTRAAPAVMMVGWGEGLDQAAEFLNTRPGLPAPRVMVGVWGGTFSYYFRGQLHDSKFAPGAGAADEWAAADFCVIYINQWQRHELPGELRTYLATLRPVLTVRLQGLDYAYVYDIRDVPPPDYLRAPPAEANAGRGEE